MVSSCYLIVSIGLDALYRIIRVIVKLIKHHLIHFVIYWHWFCSGENTFRAFVFLLLEPWVASNFSNAITLLRVCVQNL
jgi:hypothetical protein